MLDVMDKLAYEGTFDDYGYGTYGYEDGVISIFIYADDWSCLVLDSSDGKILHSCKVSDYADVMAVYEKMVR